MRARTYLVLGATGTTGRRVAATLRSDGNEVRATSRSSHGPGAVSFEWCRPESWGPALHGVTGVYVMAPDGVDVAPGFVAEAEQQGVARIVLLSSSAVVEMGDQRLLDAERLVAASSAEWTILRPSWFDQNFDEGFFRPSVLAGEVSMPLGDLRQAFVDAGDIAAVAAAALTRPGHAGETYEVRGPQALTFDEAVAEIARASGRDVRYVGDPEHWLRAQVRDGMPEEAAGAVLASFTALRERGPDEPNDVVERVAGKRPTSFTEYAAAAAAAGAWTAPT